MANPVLNHAATTVALGAASALANPGAWDEVAARWEKLTPTQKWMAGGAAALLLGGAVWYLASSGDEAPQGSITNDEATAIVRDYMSSARWRTTSKPTQRPPGEYPVWGSSPNPTAPGHVIVSAMHLVHGTVKFDVAPNGIITVLG